MENREGKIFICQHCGNEVKFIHDGGGQPICCGDPMTEKK
jgi:superoxide reductase